MCEVMIETPQQSKQQQQKQQSLQLENLQTPLSFNLISPPPQNNHLYLINKSSSTITSTTKLSHNINNNEQQQQQQKKQQRLLQSNLVLLEQLSDYLLIEITDRLDNIDKISFLLTCKRLWNLKKSIQFNVKDSRIAYYHSIARYRFNAIHDSLSKQTNGMVWGWNSIDTPIPLGTRYLRFSDQFNQSIPIGYIPSSVEKLYFGKSFNQPLLPGVVPHHVVKLELGYSFNQPLYTGVIPSSVKTLIIGALRDMGVFGGQQTLVDFDDSYRGASQRRVSDNVVCGTYRHNLVNGAIPQSVESIYIDMDTLITIEFPSALKKLKLHVSHLYLQLPDDFIPQSVETLVLHYTKPAQLILPKKLKSLVLGRRMQTIPPKYFPTTGSLTHLSLKSNEHDIIKPGDIPESVTHLQLGDYSGPLPSGTIPLSVTHLSIQGSKFKYQFQEDDLPPSLTSLELAMDYSTPILPQVLPLAVQCRNKIQQLVFGSRFLEDYQYLPLENIDNLIVHIDSIIALQSHLKLFSSSSSSSSLSSSTSSTSNQLLYNSINHIKGIFIDSKSIKKVSNLIDQDQLILPSSVESISIFCSMQIFKIPLSWFIGKNNNIRVVRIHSNYFYDTIYFRRVSNDYLLILDQNMVGGFLQIKQENNQQEQQQQQDISKTITTATKLNLSTFKCINSNNNLFFYDSL